MIRVALIFTVVNLATGDEEVTAAMVIEYINANYPELAQVLKQYPEILQRICQAVPACANLEMNNFNAVLLRYKIAQIGDLMS